MTAGKGFGKFSEADPEPPIFTFEQDDSGHWYALPEKMKAEWIALTEKIESTNEDIGEWYDLVAQFDSTFSQYMLNGGPHGKKVVWAQDFILGTEQ